MDPLKWTPETELALWRAMHSPRKKWIAGGACLFFKLNRRVGAKLYRSLAQRDYAVRLQDKAHGKGLGPEVGDLFELHAPDMFGGHYATDVKRRKMFGYLTQLADVRRRHVEDKAEMDAFLEKADKAGLAKWDLCWMNVGRLDGKLVCIDFDEMSHG